MLAEFYDSASLGSEQGCTALIASFLLRFYDRRGTYQSIYSNQNKTWCVNIGGGVPTVVFGYIMGSDSREPPLIVL